LDFGRRTQLFERFVLLHAGREWRGLACAYSVRPRRPPRWPSRGDRFVPPCSRRVDMSRPSRTRAGRMRMTETWRTGSACMAELQTDGGKPGFRRHRRRKWEGSPSRQPRGQPGRLRLA